MPLLMVDVEGGARVRRGCCVQRSSIQPVSAPLIGGVVVHARHFHDLSDGRRSLLLCCPKSEEKVSPARCNVHSDQSSVGGGVLVTLRHSRLIDLVTERTPLAQTM